MDDSDKKLRTLVRVWEWAGVGGNGRGQTRTVSGPCQESEPSWHRSAPGWRPISTLHLLPSRLIRRPGAPVSEYYSVATSFPAQRASPLVALALESRHASIVNTITCAGTRYQVHIMPLLITHRVNSCHIYSVLTGLHDADEPELGSK